MFIGIDPGESGALAFVDAAGFSFTCKFNGWRAMRDILRPYARTTDSCVGIEKVHGFPGMNVKAMTSFMINFGGWISILECLEIPHVMIPPKTWQKEILGSFPKGKSKPTALKYANRKWPKLNLKKEDDGIVDALCIAQYMKQTKK